MSDELPFDDVVRFQARQWFVDGMDYDDLVQEGRIAAWRSMQTFDPSRGMTARSYAQLAVTSIFATLLKAATREKRRAMLRYASLDSPASADTSMLLAEILADWRPSIADQLADEALVAALWDGIGLSPLEHAALRGTMEGRAYSEIGDDPKAVDNALQRAKRKLSVLA